MSFFDDSNPGAYLDINKVGIYFRAKQCSGSPSSTFSNYQSLQSIPGAAGAYIEQYSDTCLAYVNPGTADPINKSTLDALTTKFATDTSNWRKLQFDLTLAGICAVVPNGLVQAIEFTYGNEKKQCLTRIYSFPSTFGVHELGHYDYPNDCTMLSMSVPNWDGAPWIYFFGPPGACVGGNIQLTRWGLIEQDGRLVKKYFSSDTFS